MRNILFILAALIGFGAFGQTNIPTRQMLADTNGVVKWPTNITSITIGGRTFTNLAGFGLALSNGQLSVDTTQLPAGSGGGTGLVTSVSSDFEVVSGELGITNVLGTGPLVRQSAATGVGTVTSVGASTTVSGLGFSGSPVTGSGTISLTGVVAVASGGTGATDASGARTSLSLVPGTNVQAWDADLDDLADGSLTGSKVGSGIDDDNVDFDDADSLWTATTIGAALEEMNDSINAGVPNGTGAKLHWSQLLGVPAGFVDGSDDGSGGGSGTMTGIAFATAAGLPFAWSPTSTTTSNTFTLSASNQTANLIFAGPSSGGAAAPTFRALVDDDVPNTITIDLATTATTANAGDSATSFFSSGTIERARGGTGADTSAFGAGLIGSDGSNNTVDVDTEVELETALGGADVVVIATDDISSANLRTALSDESGTGAAVFAGGDVGAATATTPAANDNDTSVATTAYVQTEESALIAANLWQGTNSTLTRVAGIGAGTTGDIIYRDANGWTNLSKGTEGQFLAVTATVPAWSNAPSGGGTWDGTPIASGTVTNLTNSSITLSGFYRTNWTGMIHDFEPIIAEFIIGRSLSASSYATPNWFGSAISSGTASASLDASNHIGQVDIASTSSANSGYSYMSEFGLWAMPGLQFEDIFRVRSTNAGTRASHGFQDSTTVSDPTDALRIFQTNNFFIPQVIVNGSLTQGYEYPIAVSTYYRILIQVTDTNNCYFSIYNSDTSAELFSTNINVGLPTGTSRVFGSGILAYHTNNSTVSLLTVDKMKLSFNGNLVR